MCACVCVFMGVHISIGVYMGMYGFVCVRTCVYNICVWIHVWSGRACVHVYIAMYKCVCMGVYVFV